MSTSTTMEVKLEDIEEAVKALRTISPESVLLNPAVFIQRKLYTGSRLDAPEKESNKAASAHILRKNVYYLARATRNVTFLAIQMTQRGIFTLDEKDEILDTEGELLKAIRFYVTLLQQEGTSFQSVLNVLRQYENTSVADILSRYPAVDDTPLAIMPRALSLAQDRVMQRPSVVKKLVRPPPGEPWSCPHCTYLNAPGGNICEICSKTKGGPVPETEFIVDGPAKGYVTCETCTFANSLPCKNCVLCLEPLAKTGAVAGPATVDEPIDLRLNPRFDYSDEDSEVDVDHSEDYSDVDDEGPIIHGSTGIDLRVSPTLCE